MIGGSGIRGDGSCWQGGDWLQHCWVWGGGWSRGAGMACASPFQVSVPVRYGRFEVAEEDGGVP